MIPKKAVERAIEGGWKDYRVLDTDRRASQIPQVIALDASFWQALGKALGWDMLSDRTSISEAIFYGICNQEAHKFYDLILTGGDTQKFWDELLSV